MKADNTIMHGLHPSLQAAGPVLVTGGAGYIGGHAVLALMDAGIQPVVLDNLSTGQWRPFHQSLTCYTASVHDQDQVKKIIADHGIKSILHFAGSIKVDESVADPLKYYYNNTEGSRRLIEVAVDSGVERFVFSSTAAVYGETGQKAASENASLTPLSPYGTSKFMTEQQLKDVCSVSAMQYGILRYFNVAGADPALRHGQFLEKPVHLIGRAIDALLGKAPPLTIFGRDLPTPDGTGVRDYIHVCDLVDAHLHLLAVMAQKSGSHLMNLGYGRGSSVLEVIAALEKVSRKRVPTQDGKLRTGEAPMVYADVSLLKETLNWTPKYDTLTTLVEDTYRWVQSIKGQ